MPISSPKIKRAALAAAFVVLTAGAAYAASSFVDYVAQKESGGNQWQTVNGSTASGAFGMTQGALQQVGLLTKTSSTSSSHYGNGDWDNVSWNDNQWGIKSREDYLNNYDAQVATASAYMGYVWNSLDSGTKSKVGTEFNGVTLNEASLLECGYILGPSGCQSYLSTGQLPSGAPAGYADVVNRRMAEASAYDASSVTGSYTAVTNSAYSSGSGGSANKVYCAPNISSLQRDSSTATVKQQVALASSPLTGFSGVDGGELVPGGSNGLLGVSTGSLFSGASGSIADSLGMGASTSYGGLSCLDGILNMGMDIFFSVPSLSQILDMILNAICNAIMAEIQGMLSPVTNMLGTVNSLGSSGFSGGGFFPGISLASLGGGLNVSVGGSGVNASGSGVDAIVTGMGGDTGWYGGNSSRATMAPATQMLNGLFGGASTSMGYTGSSTIDWQ